MPLLARARDDAKSNRNPESFYARIDENTSAATLESLRLTAQAGGRVYLEGAPNPKSVLAARTRELGGGTLTALDKPQESAMKLDDAWLFGILRGQTLPVTQLATVKLAPPTIAGQAKIEEGVDKLTQPRVVATLADGTPALILNPVGKGEVLWNPHGWNGNVDLRAFDAAVAGWLGPALVRLSPVGKGDVSQLRLALRRSPKGALLLCLTNEANSDISADLAIDGAPGVCLDLTAERELSLSTRGFEGRTNVTVPANGYLLLAFAENRKALDEERNAVRLKARLR
jgi:hypothetical protein